MAFTHLLLAVTAHRYGIEIDAYRAEQACALGIETLQANTMDVRCQAEAVSLLCLNPPYDWESGESNNQRLEFVFLEHTYRWLKAGGVLIFVACGCKSWRSMNITEATVVLLVGRYSAPSW